MEFTDDLLSKTGDRKKRAQANANLIFAVASLADMPTAEKEAARLSACCSYWEWDAYHKNKLLDLRKVNRCRSRFCPNCRAINTARIVHEILPAIQNLRLAGHGLYHITLTVPNVPPAELGATCEHMAKAFRVFWDWMSAPPDDKKKGYKGRPFQITGAIRSLEITFNEKTRLFHPHFHVLVLLPGRLAAAYMAREYQTAWDLRRQEWTLHSKAELDTGQIWAAAFTGSGPDNGAVTYECAVKEVRDHKGLIEVLKYPAKDSDFEKMDVTEFIFLYRAIKARRIRQAYGNLYNVELEDIKNEGPQETDLLKSFLQVPENPELLSTAFDLLLSEYHDYRKISRYRAHEGLNSADDVEKTEPKGPDFAPNSTKSDHFCAVSGQNQQVFSANSGKIDIQLSIRVNE